MNLNILYCSDNNYAPYLGISMTSLLENNKGAQTITIYVVCDNIDNQNIDKLKAQVNRYGETRRLILIDGKKWVQKLADLKLLPYRGGLTTNLRLFFMEYIKNDVQRILYLDCDTIVCDSLIGLFDTSMNETAVAVVQESLGDCYTPLINFSPKDRYFNAGVVLFDVKNWTELHCQEKLSQMMNDPQYRYPNNDQDFLNMLLREHKTILHPRYNFQTTHGAYTNDLYFKHYPKDHYYSEQELQEAKEKPAILHAYRFLGQFPWHRQALHPYRENFWEYVPKSEWHDLKPRKNKGKVFAIERLIYRIFPKCLFLPLFKAWQGYYFKKKLKLIRKGKKS